MAKDSESTNFKLKHEESEIEKISNLLGDVEDTGDNGKSLMNQREKLVRDKDSLSNEIRNLNKDELRAHNIIKQNNERMYYLEYSNVELTDKLSELIKQKDELQKILFDEKLQSNKYESQMQQYKVDQIDEKEALEKTKNSNTAITQMIENSKFLISRMQRENNFVEKLKWMKTLMVKLESSFSQMQNNKRINTK